MLNNSEIRRHSHEQFIYAYCKVITKCQFPSNAKFTMTRWNIGQWCVLLILFKYKAAFISHQWHSSIAECNNYFISLQISLSYGKKKSKVPLAVRRVGHGFLDHSLNINHCLTVGGVLLLSTSVTDSLLPLTLQHRTCSCTIKVRKLQSDDSNGKGVRVNDIRIKIILFQHRIQYIPLVRKKTLYISLTNNALNKWYLNTF